MAEKQDLLSMCLFDKEGDNCREIIENLSAKQINHIYDNCNRIMEMHQCELYISDLKVDKDFFVTLNLKMVIGFSG